MSPDKLVGVRTPLHHRIVFVSSAVEGLHAGEWVLVEIGDDRVPARVVVPSDHLVHGDVPPVGTIIERSSAPDSGTLRDLAATTDDPHHLGRVGSSPGRESPAKKAFWDEVRSTGGRIGQRVEIDGRRGIIVRLNVLEKLATVRFDEGDEVELPHSDLPRQAAE